MSTLAVDMPFDFSFPSASIERQSPAPVMTSLPFDQAFLDMAYASASANAAGHGHGHISGHSRSSSRASVYSTISAQSDHESLCSRLTTPPRASPAVRQHGPLLLPKIRSQDQDIDATPCGHYRMTTPPAPNPSRHSRSYTNPESLSITFDTPASIASVNTSFSSQPDDTLSASLLASPANFATHISGSHSRRASSLDATTIDRYGYPTYRQMPSFVPVTPQQQPDYGFATYSYSPRAQSPLSLAATPDPTPNTNLLSFLTSSNPAASLVRHISFPVRDATTKHFWWDVRNIRSWSSFNASTILSLPGAPILLTNPVPAPLLPQPVFTSRHPENEAQLHSIYASYYLPKLNSALAMSSTRPLHLSVPPKTTGMNDLLFVANAAGESATAAAMFGGKPTARVVGLVRSFDRFNTGMRVEGNIKRVEYLRGLAAIHHAMREHGCRYGFILTEIELVLVRNGTANTPFFGDLEVTSVQLAASAPEGDASTLPHETPLTACLALWGLCQLASDDTPAGNAHWRAEIGAPAEGTRRKAQPRDSWMPQPQLAEKREAKRSRGWVWPEDAIGRKELGKRGVRYGGV
ncbi:sialidase [Fusarium heterosporum]|uniref:Sialidase n=1 Tax=Fusarium heterosporum TaxID=42747 RepID=A0A8H5TL98_FUSHE|nr:sialidase [Fusarium heterosporum]